MGKLFGTSGVRGVVGQELTPELVMDLGLALATFLEGSGRVVVGKDPRTTSDMLEGCLVAGLLSGGCDVVKLGVIPTPALALAVSKLNARAGAMVTASHNPPEYNGLKFWGQELAFTPEQEAEIEEIYFSKRGKRASWDKIGQVERGEIMPEYLELLVSGVSLSKGYKVVVDCGNGAGALATPQALRELGCKVITLNSQLDGHFPGRGLEPSPENLEELCKVVKSVGADLGLAHDGDADRIAAVDERGRVASPDKLLALISAHEVKRGETIVTTVDASSVVDELVHRQGGKVIRTRVGDVSVALELKRRGAVFGGEPSGSWIFSRVHLAPDGPLAGVRLLELLDVEGRKLSELLDELPEYPMIRVRFQCREDLKHELMRRFEESVSREFSGVVEKLTIDGIRLSFEDGSWVLVRPSGTEPYIRVTAEGKTEERAKELADRAVKILTAVA